MGTRHGVGDDEQVAANVVGGLCADLFDCRQWIVGSRAGAVTLDGLDRAPQRIDHDAGRGSSVRRLFASVGWVRPALSFGIVGVGFPGRRVELLGSARSCGTP